MGIVSFLTPTTDAATFAITPEVDSAREVTASLSLYGQGAAEGIVVPVYLSGSPEGFGRSVVGNIQEEPAIYPAHFQTDQNGQFVVTVAVESDESATLYLVVVLPSGALAVSEPLTFAT